MNENTFNAQLNGTPNFHLRRAVERIREGLFDPMGVQWLTSGEEKLNRLFDQGAEALNKGNPHHLCICGAYGQGKSHSLTYLKQRALENNFVVSYINLDPRQIPFHDFKEVYRALMAAMVFPHGETSLARIWQESAAQWLARPENTDKSINDFIPGDIPHRFRAILAAMAHRNMELPANKRNLKKHARFQPRSFSWTLKSALMGKEIPIHKLCAAFHYREVPFYKGSSLACREPKEYLDMVKGLARLFKAMGYGGWVLLFDEGESIGQARITSRSKSYDLLHEIFCPEKPAQGFFPVFAFTHDFFTLVETEPWDRTRRPGGRRIPGQPVEEIPCFTRNFHKAWKGIKVHTLQDLSPDEWESLSGKLKILHGRAYRWKPEAADLVRKMMQVLSQNKGAEPRMKLRLLVNHLDLEQQKEP
ncbi:BREX system ATP-binding domain-containing protein [uncultured Desulfobacter sp.]|uniref:BREX system ATP-binding domain-containing protein n=1 Tax=uncultured Desulfobacter sp. TaxID=240139 RepID=UPI002AAB1BF3|nr:BREX system ATP-binding domain-containing protein [uncultured Desulfobacter sp.]